MKNKIALIVGRFQPFHKGHLFLIKKALEKADRIIIGIGSANVSDENNPIDFEMRRKVIKAVAYKERFEDRLIKIVPLDDFHDDKKWLENVKKQVGDFNIVVSNNDWTNKIVEKDGFKVLRIPYYKRELYEGWRIRKLIKEGKKWQDRVPKYLISNIKDQISKIQIKDQKFKHVVLGGTFDKFHLGHKKLLEKAFEVGKKVIIGIATEEIYKNKFLSETIESFSERKKSVSEFLKKKDWLKRTKLISFSNFTGGADKEKNIDAVVVSNLTYPNALKINQLREKNKLPLLKVITINDVLADDGKLISSERIRAGEIDREGNNFQFSPDLIGVQKKEIIMPESLRPVLQKPLGQVFKDEKSLLQCINTLKHIMIIAVGDIIVDSLLKTGIDPDVKIIDFRSRRKKRTDLFAKLQHIQKGPSLINKPGTINLKTAEKLKQLIQSNLSLRAKRSNLDKEIASSSSAPRDDRWLVIDGEEDLLALPAILFAPLNSLVLYGHWQHGIIAVEVNEKMKNKALSIIDKFN